MLVNLFRVRLDWLKSWLDLFLNQFSKMTYNKYEMFNKIKNDLK